MTVCAKCGGTGKLTYRTIGDAAPTDTGRGYSVQDMGGFGTRACECVRDLPPIFDSARWWETETLLSEVVQVPIHNECVEIEASGEVPRREDGRRCHRTIENCYYPPLIHMESSGSLTLLAEDARSLAEALLRAAEACEKADEPVEALRCS